MLTVFQAALFGAAVAFVSPACEGPDVSRSRDVPAPSVEDPQDQQPEPQSHDDGGDDENDDEGLPRTEARNPSLKPVCFDDDDWHKKGYCLARCKGDKHYEIVSERRKTNDHWCQKRAWNYCDNRDRKLKSWCWGWAGWHDHDDDWDDDDHDWDDDDDHDWDDDDDDHDHDDDDGHDWD